MVKAVLSCFHGPVVEGSFSEMSNILTEKTHRTKVDTFTAYQIVSYEVKDIAIGAVESFLRSDKLRTPIQPGLLKNMRNANAERESEQARQREEMDSRKTALEVHQKKIACKRKLHDQAFQLAKKAKVQHLDKLKKKL